MFEIKGIFACHIHVVALWYLAWCILFYDSRFKIHERFYPLHKLRKTKNCNTKIYVMEGLL